MTTQTIRIEPLEALALEDLTEEEAAAVTGGGEIGKIRGQVATNNLGPTNRQKKHVTKMRFDPMTFG